MNSIRTSQQDWLVQALNHYVNKSPFSLIDDAGLGLKEEDLKSAIGLISAARMRGLSLAEIVRLLASLGVCGLGVGLIVVAVMDPEPTSKFGCLLAGGVVLILTGSLSLLASLGLRWSISVKWNNGACSFEAIPS
jgi:hypothetical protein